MLILQSDGPADRAIGAAFTARYQHRSLSRRLCRRYHMLHPHPQLPGHSSSSAPLTLTWMTNSTSISLLLFCQFLFSFLHLVRMIMQHLPVVRATSPFFSKLILLGCLLAFAAVPFLAMEPGNAPSELVDVACIAPQFLVSLGFSLIMTSLLARSYVLANGCLCEPKISSPYIA